MGVMGEPEGIDYLLRMVKYIVREKKRTDIHFMLIVSGPAIENLKELSQELKITEYVEFTGFRDAYQAVSALCDRKK